SATRSFTNHPARAAKERDLFINGAGSPPLTRRGMGPSRNQPSASRAVHLGELAPRGVVKLARNIELRVVLEERERGAERAVRRVASLADGVAQVAEALARAARALVWGVRQRVDARAREQEGATLDRKRRLARVALDGLLHLALAGSRPLDALTARLQH